MTKIKAYELSKGFGIPSKEIVKVLHDYGVSEKNHMSALDENELDVIFEYYTQKNQVEDFSALFAVPVEAEKPKKEEAKAEKTEKEEHKPEVVDVETEFSNEPIQARKTRVKSEAKRS